MVAAAPTFAFAPIAVASDYNGLHAAFRARAEQLEVSREVLDDLSGLADGYCGKLLGNKQVRRLGPLSIGPLLNALGLVLIIAEDKTATEKIRAQAAKRQTNLITSNGLTRGPKPKDATP